MATPSSKGTSPGSIQTGGALPEAASFESFSRPNDPGGHVYGPGGDSAIASVDIQKRGQEKDERNLNDVKKHTHDGQNSQRIDWGDLRGIIRTVSVVPSTSTNVRKPKSVSEQILLYANGGTFRLYIYDAQNDAWRYTALT